MFTQCYDQQQWYEQHGYWQNLLHQEGYADGLYAIYYCEGHVVRVKRKARFMNVAGAGNDPFVFNPEGVTVITAANSQSATMITAAPSVCYMG